jgi:hypothetical protein
MNEGCHLAGILGREVLRYVEIPDFTAKTYRERGNVDTGYRPDTALPCQDTGPGFIDGISYRRNYTEAGDNYTSSGQHPTPASGP